MGLVKLGDASTWKLQETLRATQAASGAATTTVAAAAPVAPGVIRLPVSRPAAALPAAPKPEYKRKAWPGALSLQAAEGRLRQRRRVFPPRRMRRR
jgi:hypothetical protein